MKVLHTSDWHLGKKLFKKERLPEQRVFLDWLTDTIKKEKVEVLCLSGDIFDSPIPPTEALSLFLSFLKDLEGLKEGHGGHLRKVIILAGNHDSGKLLEAPNPLLDKSLYQVIGRFECPKSLSEEDLKEWRQKFTWFDEKENVLIGVMPFFRTREVMNNPWFKHDEEGSQNLGEHLLEVINIWQKELRQDFKGNCLFMGHHLFGSFFSAGSEQGVTLSGLDSLPLSSFSQWDALLLGHIHKPQLIKKENPLAIYSGSPIPMRFSEQEKKTVYLYDNVEALGEKSGVWNYKALPIPVFRPLIRLEANEIDFKERINEELGKYQLSEGALPAYLELTIKFDTLKAGFIDQVREYIHDLPLELISYYSVLPESLREAKQTSKQHLTDSTTSELFEKFLETKKLDKDQRKNVLSTFNHLLETINQPPEELGGDV